MPQQNRFKEAIVPALGTAAAITAATSYPKSAGEIAYATDTKQPYFGNDPATGGSFNKVPMEYTNNVWTGTNTFSGGFLGGYVAKTSTYAIAAGDYVIDCSGTFTATLPTAVGVQGKIYNIKNSGTGIITVNTTSSQTIDGDLIVTLTQWDCLTVISNNLNWLII